MHSCSGSAAWLAKASKSSFTSHRILDVNADEGVGGHMVTEFLYLDGIVVKEHDKDAKVIMNLLTELQKKHDLDMVSTHQKQVGDIMKYIEKQELSKAVPGSVTTDNKVYKHSVALLQVHYSNLLRLLVQH